MILNIKVITLMKFWFVTFSSVVCLLLLYVYKKPVKLSKDLVFIQQFAVFIGQLVVGTQNVFKDLNLHIILLLCFLS
ncbi:MAG: hypothetical protein SVZ03_00040 [Spirochaetota bacterium]|nr:hypothetical protein [Spirochaetota bacterium]